MSQIDSPNGGLDSYLAWLEHALAYANNQSSVQRYGQALYNHLYWWKPEIAKKVLGTKLDPYYNSKNVKAFLEFVEKEWK